MWNIALSKIDCDGPPIDMATVKPLLESIKLHGLLHAITVTKGEDGRYKLVAGRHRFAACQRLGMRKIAAMLVPNDPTLIEMITITENFHRREMPPGERQTAMLRYAELFRKVKPAEGKKKLAKQTAKQLRQEQAAKQNGEVPARKENEPEVVRAIAETFGVSPRTAQQTLKRASVFSESQLDTMRRRGCSDRQIDNIAALPVEARISVLGLVTEGLSFEDAWTEVLAVPTNSTRERLAQQEFLETLELYGDERVNRQRFAADALLYRAMQDTRLKLIRDVHWDKIKTEQGRTGVYFRAVMRHLDCPHPRNWIPCGRCRGGYTEAGECRACAGGGYLLG